MIDRKRVRKLARVGDDRHGDYLGAHTRYIFDTAEALAKVMAAIAAGELPPRAPTDELLGRFRAAGLGPHGYLHIIEEFYIRFNKHKNILCMRTKIRGRPSPGRRELDRRLRRVGMVFAYFAYIETSQRPQWDRVSAALIAALAPCEDAIIC